MPIFKVRNLPPAVMTLIGTCLLLAGCGKPPPDPVQLRADEKTLIQSTVAEPARASRLLDLIEQRERLSDETRAMQEKFRREMYLLNADYEARREVAVEIIDVYNRERADKELRFIDLITAMKQTTTAEEWRIIADFQLKHVGPRQLLLQPAGNR